MKRALRKILGTLCVLALVETTIFNPTHAESGQEYDNRINQRAFDITLHNGRSIEVELEKPDLNITYKEILSIAAEDPDTDKIIIHDVMTFANDDDIETTEQESMTIGPKRLAGMWSPPLGSTHKYSVKKNHHSHGAICER